MEIMQLIKESISQLVNYNPKAIIIYNNQIYSSKNNHYLSLKKIKIFFYLMDMEFVTGGCHYNFECKILPEAVNLVRLLNILLKKGSNN